MLCSRDGLGLDGDEHCSVLPLCLSFPISKTGEHCSQISRLAPSACDKGTRGASRGRGAGSAGGNTTGMWPPVPPQHPRSPEHPCAAARRSAGPQHHLASPNGAEGPWPQSSPWARLWGAAWGVLPSPRVPKGEVLFLSPHALGTGLGKMQFWGLSRVLKIGRHYKYLLRTAGEEENSRQRTVARDKYWEEAKVNIGINNDTSQI